MESNTPEPHRKLAGWRRSVRNGSLAALFTIAGMEVFIRIAGLAPPVPKDMTRGDYIADPHLPYRPKPNAQFEVQSRTGEFDYPVKHNELGWRDRSHETNKPPGTIRILGLGDSFTYGAGAPFEQTYLAVLEQELNPEGADVTTEVLKAGMGGYFPAAERLLLEHEGLAFAPDIVLVAFNHTDLVESLLGIDELRVEDGYLKTAAARRLGRAGTFLFIRSHLARLVLSRVRGLRVKTATDDVAESESAAWKQVENEYARMKALCDRHGARLLIVYIPLELPTPLDELGQLQAIGSRQDIAVINTGPSLEAAGKTRPVFWKQDGHCTPHGYRSIALAVAESLKKE